MISLRPGRRLQPVGGDDASDPPVDQPPAPLVTLANRLPVVKTRGVWRTADGGLVAALRPTLETRPTSWVGWDGGSKTFRTTLPGLEARLVPISLRKSLGRGYYHGFANRTLWPLFHGLADRAVLDRRWWRDYAEANERFAERRSSRGAAAPLLWVHDYQLLPRARPLLRRSARRSRSGSSCTSRSRPPSCSRACPGATTSSRGCSAPTSSASRPQRVPTATSSAPASV